MASVHKPNVAASVVKPTARNEPNNTPGRTARLSVGSRFLWPWAWRNRAWRASAARRRLALGGLRRCRWLQLRGGFGLRHRTRLRGSARRSQNARRIAHRSTARDRAPLSPPACRPWAFAAGFSAAGLASSFRGSLGSRPQPFGTGRGQDFGDTGLRATGNGRFRLRRRSSGSAAAAFTSGCRRRLVRNGRFGRGRVSEAAAGVAAVSYVRPPEYRPWTISFFLPCGLDCRHIDSREVNRFRVRLGSRSHALRAIKTQLVATRRSRKVL